MKLLAQQCFCRLKTTGIKHGALQVDLRVLGAHAHESSVMLEQLQPNLVGLGRGGGNLTRKPALHHDWLAVTVPIE